MKQIRKRECTKCGEIKSTTNTDYPYIGRECYETKGRKKLLDENKYLNITKGDLVTIIVCSIMIGIILTFFTIKLFGG